MFASCFGRRRSAQVNHNPNPWAGSWELDISGAGAVLLNLYPDGTAERGGTKCKWEVIGKLLILRAKWGNTIFEYYPEQVDEHMAILLRGGNTQTLGMLTRISFYPSAP